MNKLTSIMAVLATTTFLFGTVACGGGAQKADDASSEAAPDDAAPKKSMEKFEGNRMEKADEEE